MKHRVTEVNVVLVRRKLRAEMQQMLQHMRSKHKDFAEECKKAEAERKGNLDLLATPASQAYVESVFCVCGHLTSGKRNRLCKKLANRTILTVNNKFYD